MTTITATKITATTALVAVDANGRRAEGCVTPGDRFGAPSIDCWMADALIDLCDAVPDADDYGLSMIDVIASEAAAALR